MDNEENGFDPALMAQMVQKFYQMEQFKEAVESAVTGRLPPPPLNPPPLPQSESPIARASTSTERTPVESDDFEETEEEVSAESIDFESMGKIDIVELTTSQIRRNNRKKLESKFRTMKRGRFWEINELRKGSGL